MKRIIIVFWLILVISSNSQSQSQVQSQSKFQSQSQDKAKPMSANKHKSSFAKAKNEGVYTNDIEYRKLSDNVYLYTAWCEVGSWGRVGSNGLILIDKDSAFLFDTPMHESQTIELKNWVNSELNAKIVGFVPNHWHDDCVGGMEYLKTQGVETYANSMTNDILKSKGLPQAKHSFTDSISLSLGEIDIKCYYLGGGHATDNIVVWIPSQNILFGGCMLKDITSWELGNTSDAATLDEWIKTVQTTKEKFGHANANAVTVVPGHGAIGGEELFDHTIEVLTKNQNR